MLDALGNLADALETLPLATRRALVGIVEHFRQQLLDLNRGYLTQEGNRPDGAPIQPQGYSRAYAALRARLGKQTAFVDMDFSGAYLDSFVLEYVGGLQFEPRATDSKAAKLFARYGQLLGVREVDLREFVIEYIEPEVRVFVGQHMNQT